MILQMDEFQDPWKPKKKKIEKRGHLGDGERKRKTIHKYFLARTLVSLLANNLEYLREFKFSQQAGYEGNL